MKIYRNLKDYNVKNAIITQGTFDGVHLGHKKILDRLISGAKTKGGDSVLLTFHPHPRHVLFPDHDGPMILNTMDEKIELLESIGLDNIIILPFTHEFSRIPAVHFVRDLLVNQIKAVKIIVGYDHHFGRNREGDINILKELAPLYEFEVEEISAHEIDEINISSTKIRKALAVGDVETANRFLGYPYQLNGKIIPGKKLGRKLGYPTANMELDERLKLIPENGVYAVKVKIASRSLKGMMSIGFNPTVEEGNTKRHLEVNIFDFDEEVYGSDIRVELIKRIRNELKFDGLDELKDQMASDKLVTMEILEGE